MYFLKKTGGTYFYLPKNGEYTIGRKDCDILIRSDNSISRKHATIKVKENTVLLQDNGAKYNTFCNNEKLIPHVDIQLKVGDEIRFGVIESVFNLEYCKIVTTTSCINNPQKDKLKEIVDCLGGTFVNNWTDKCTHLTVDEITLTLKVLHALLDEKPIVQSNYWSAYQRCMKKNLPPPDIELFNKPPMAEALINKMSLEINPNRKKVFRQKVFIFSNDKIKKQMEEIVVKAGGDCILFNKEVVSMRAISNSKKEYLIIQSNDISETSDFNNLIKSYAELGKRTIPLQEIAMAIVQGSCEKDCNPNFNRISEVFKMKTPRMHDPPLILNTQDGSPIKQECKEELIIPETIHSNFELSQNSKIDTVEIEPIEIKSGNKRVLSSDEESNPFKKIKIQSNKSNSTKPSEHLQPKKEKAMKCNPFSLIRNGCTKEQLHLAMGKSAESSSQADSLSFNTQNNLNIFLKTNRSKIDNSNNEPNISCSKFTAASTTEVSLNSKAEIDETDLAPPKKQFFKVPTSKRTVKSSVDIPLKRIKYDTVQNETDKHNTDIVLNSTLKENIFNASLASLELSRINSPRKKKHNSTGWLSKTISSTQQMNQSNTTISEEMEKILALFRDVVQVEILSTGSIRQKNLENIENEIFNSTKTNTKNFKKFRKIQPLKPQKTIINNLTLVEQMPGTLIKDEIYDSDSETCTTNRIKKSSAKKQPKRIFFNFKKELSS